MGVLWDCPPAFRPRRTMSSEAFIPQLRQSKQIVGFFSFSEILSNQDTGAGIDSDWTYLVRGFWAVRTVKGKEIESLEYWERSVWSDGPQGHGIKGKGLGRHHHPSWKSLSSTFEYWTLASEYVTLHHMLPRTAHNTLDVWDQSRGSTLFLAPSHLGFTFI